MKLLHVTELYGVIYLFFIQLFTYYNTIEEICTLFVGVESEFL
jgi:hypothetical protein